jgi:anti-sigma B factor antagonist
MLERSRAEQSPNGRHEHLEWSVSADGGEVVVALEGEMDLANADALGAALTAVLDTRPARVIVDLANLSFLDSSGIRCLLIASDQAAAIGAKLFVTRPTGSIRRVLEVTGTDALLLERSAGDALEHR